MDPQKRTGAQGRATDQGTEPVATRDPIGPEVKPTDIIAWASQPSVWTFPHDQILKGKGPNRERIRDSLGDPLDRSDYCQVEFEIDPSTTTLPDIALDSMSFFQIKGCIGAVVWISDASGNRSPRNACLIRLVRCHASTRRNAGALGCVFMGIDSLHNTAIWLIYDTQTRTGRILRIDH